MSKILQFPVKLAEPGTVYCRPLKIRFPRLYRVHVQSTREQQALFFGGSALPEGVVLEDYERTYFTLNPATTDIGTITSAVVTHLRTEDAAYSLLIRHHASQSIAWSYLDALSDREFDAQTEELDSCLYETSDGIFTYIKRPTPNSAKGPLVIRTARTRELDPGGDERDWVHIVSHEGKELNPLDFGYGDLR